MARLDPNRPPLDVPGQRWMRFIDDCGHFLHGGWAERAHGLGWGPFDLFGCDSERPFARLDRLGLLWLINGNSLAILSHDTAVIETLGGARLTYRRRPVEPGSCFGLGLNGSSQA